MALLLLVLGTSTVVAPLLLLLPLIPLPLPLCFRLRLLLRGYPCFEGKDLALQIDSTLHSLVEGPKGVG